MAPIQKVEITYNNVSGEMSINVDAVDSTFPMMAAACFTSYVITAGENNKDNAFRIFTSFIDMVSRELHAHYGTDTTKK